MESTTSMMVSPGKNDTHQPEVVAIRSRPSATIRPQAGLGLGMPAPRKLKVDFDDYDEPDLEGGQHHQAVEHVREDMPEHDSSVGRSCDLGPRYEIRRANRQGDAAGHAGIVRHRSSTSTAMTVAKLAPRAATSARATRMMGMERDTSTALIITASSHLPKKPAEIPKTVPIEPAMKMAIAATTIEIREP